MPAPYDPAPQRSASAVAPLAPPAHAHAPLASRAASTSATPSHSPAPPRLLTPSLAHTPTSTSSTTPPPPSLPPSAAGTPLPAGAPPPSLRKHRKAVSTTGVPDTPRHRRTLSSVEERSMDSSTRDPYSALEDLRSLRSSGRRRLRALCDLECALAVACTGDVEDREVFVSLEVHTPLLALLGRHTASLAKRASTSSLPTGDELARHLAPEIDNALTILQGLTLLSRSCKAAVGERWTLEMFLDLLLLLRTQTPEGNARPTVYAILDLLFCVLVDSPEHARMFEDLQGLEAVTRVLRGTGVAKDVRMKCCEFLYFYLLPEGSTTMPDAYSLPPLPAPRSASSSSATSAESNDSTFPVGQDMTPAHSRVSSLEQPRPSSPERWTELTDLPFVPQTPRKPAKPSLGFQTPSANRRTSGASVVSVLTPVAQSPDDRKRQDHAEEGPSREPSISRTDSGSPLGFEPKGSKHLRGLSCGPPSVPSSPRPDGIRPSSKRAAGKSPLGHSAAPALESARRHSRSQSASVAPVGPPGTPARDRQRSRAFPSELTRGVLPSAGPLGPAPLTPSRRIPSGRPESRPGTVKSSAGAGGSIRSVAEKKEMLGMWLGNVDQLVQGVEKVGFWAKKENM